MTGFGVAREHEKTDCKVLFFGGSTVALGSLAFRPSFDVWQMVVNRVFGVTRRCFLDRGKEREYSSSCKCFYCHQRLLGVYKKKKRVMKRLFKTKERVNSWGLAVV
jgi:hypothetical protein